MSRPLATIMSHLSLSEAPARSRHDLQALQGELDRVVLYRALADAEADPKTAEAYRKLAQIEATHADYWQRRLKGRGESGAVMQPSWRTRTLGWLARRFGIEFVEPLIGDLDHVEADHFTHHPAARPADPTQGRAARRASAALSLLRRKRGGGGNALRAAVLGANDGLVSNLSLVMGVAGATIDASTLLITGFAGLVAGACSMAMGEWLSVNSARELYGREIARTRRQMEQSPEREADGLTMIYQEKGLSETQAKLLARQLMSNKHAALDTVVREELGIDPDELGGSAWAAAAASFFLFAIGAIFPVLGLLLFGDMRAIWAGLAASGMALFAIGAGTSLFTGRSLLFSGLRQLLIGFAAAGITFLIGRLVGVGLAG
jgi:VIT1/CCC1 family predicted Fe2+/Mn2+ transporter